MSRVRGQLERLHRELAAVSGNVSLLLTQETITRRDVLQACVAVEAALKTTDALRAETKLPERTRD